MDVAIENSAAFHDDYELFRVQPAQLDDTSAVPLVKLIDFSFFDVTCFYCRYDATARRENIDERLQSAAFDSNDFLIFKFRFFLFDALKVQIDSQSLGMSQPFCP